MKKCIILILILLITTSCSTSDSTDISVLDDIDNINIDLINISKLENGHYYSLKLSNNSNRDIKYIELSIGFEPTDYGKEFNLSNKAIFNAVAETPFDIEPNESIDFSVYIPSDMITEEIRDYEDIEVSVVGYFYEIELENRFTFMGNLESYSSLVGDD